MTGALVPSICWQEGLLVFAAGRSWLTVRDGDLLLLRARGAAELAVLAERLSECPGLWQLRNASFWPLLPGKSDYGLVTTENQLYFASRDLSYRQPVCDEIMADLLNWLDGAAAGTCGRIELTDGQISLPLEKSGAGCNFKPLIGGLQRLAAELLCLVRKPGLGRPLLFKLHTASGVVEWQLEFSGVAHFNLFLRHLDKTSENIYLSRAAVGKLACRLAAHDKADR